jgi:hypothetical protein
MQNVALNSGLAHRGVVLMHLVGGSDVFLVAATGGSGGGGGGGGEVTTSPKAYTVVHLGEDAKVIKVEVLFDTQWMAYDDAGRSFEIRLTGGWWPRAYSFFCI